MSLTNPKDVITEERLSDFYQGILPYLGGMPEILANKFSKGDLYSTDEKMIGQWIDGKPLYQKTIELSSAITASQNAWADTGITSASLNIDKFVGQNATAIDDTASSGSYINFPVYVAIVSNNIKLLQTRTEQQKIKIFTIQYTKTTDQPISIGADTDYSTTEKIVGTWIDGKPLYQKTIDCGAIPNATSKSVALNITNLSDIVSMSGIMLATSGGVRYNNPLLWVGGSSDALNKCAVYREGNNLVIQSGINLSVYNESYITIQYTKTTA